MRTFAQAKAFALQQHASPRRGGWFQACQVFSRQCVGAPSFGKSARLAFNAIPAAHKHTSSPPPAGSIAYFGPPDHGHGHAVFVVEGGYVWSNDIVRHGKIDRVKWDVFIHHWHQPYRGWIDSCPSGRLPVLGATAKVSPTYRQAKKVFRSKMRYRQPNSDSVWNLQVALMAKRIPFAEGPTGYYGSHTRDCCAAFQRLQGWRGADANGIAGPQTVKRLGLVWVNG